MALIKTSDVITNFCKDKLSKGEKTVGIWSLMPSPSVVDVLSSASLDFIIFDMEHGAFDTKAVQDAILISHSRCSPIVRIPSINHVLIQRILDTGAHGIVAPQIKSAADVESYVRAFQFYPNGKRGFNPFTKAGEYAENANSEYYGEAFPLVIGILENLDAYRDLDAILDVDGVDVWYLGIYDIACALGHADDLQNEEVQKVMSDIRDRLASKGKISGCMIDNIKGMYEKGESFLVLKPDTYQLMTSLQSKLNCEE